MEHHNASEATEARRARRPYQKPASLGVLAFERKALACGTKQACTYNPPVCFCNQNS